MLESVFNKVVSLQACNFVKKTLQHMRYYVQFEKFLKTLFLRTLYKTPFYSNYLCVFWKSGEDFSPEQLTNRMLAGNNFTENFNTYVLVGFLQNV